MGAITHSIEVNAPLQAVYNQWIRFAEFPRFMGGVDEVRPDGPTKLFWRAKIGGKEKQWEAEITDQVPNKRIAWQSVEGAANRGAVAFEPVSVSTTRITLTMEYEPEGFIEQVGDALGLPLGQVAEDLNRFRDLMEKRGDEAVARGGQTEPAEAPASAGQVTRGEDAEDAINVADWTERKTSLANQESPEIVVAGAIPTDSERTSDNIAATRDESLHRGEHSSEVPSGPGVPADKGFIRAENYEKDDPRTRAGVPTYEQIARRAYERYLERGENPGSPHEDWLASEKELSEKFRGAGRD
ncbi:MAG TPA: SRPBCC family protein [Chthoniobacterales bacterium]